MWPSGALLPRASCSKVHNTPLYIAYHKINACPQSAGPSTCCGGKYQIGSLRFVFQLAAIMAKSSKCLRSAGKENRRICDPLYPAEKASA